MHVHSYFFSFCLAGHADIYSIWLCCFSSGLGIVTTVSLGFCCRGKGRPDEERKKRLQRKGKKSEAENFRETFLNGSIKCLFDLLFT